MGNVSGITDGHQNCEECECNVRKVIGALKKDWEVKNAAEDFENF